MGMITAPHTPEICLPLSYVSVSSRGGAACDNTDCRLSHLRTCEYFLEKRHN